ncbi:thiamine-phosphate kinase [Nocardia sp. CNY236]|uniref:thiamine-phosphate kinase n=1 Tax=Nocardia sp. CNY236 TaxID=1169152 RepID=UPI00040195E8|nr:thiamine-phosphate kinase [Nocardia sp. CNY236]
MAISDSSAPRTVRELGEFALIDRINAGRVQAPAVVLGPGDDAALVMAPGGRVVLTTDMLVQDRHFRLDWSSPADIGRKAIAQNAADVVAMGAMPTAFVVALGCRADTPLEVIDDLVDGLWAEAIRAGGSVAGGDLVCSRELIVSVTAMGALVSGSPIERAGARVGDVVAVSGRLGWSAAGLAAFTAGVTGAEVEQALAAHRVPQPPYATVLDALQDRAIDSPAGQRVPQRPNIGLHALTDVSDGLLADLGHIAGASGVAIALDSAALHDPALEPIAAVLDADAVQWILTGGEDHAFVGTWAPDRPLPAGWLAIGRVEAGAGLTVDGAATIGDGGWESFRATGSGARW